jgi:hypothetical protein
VRKIVNCDGCSLAVTVDGDTPALSGNAFQYRCDWARETRSHPATSHPSTTVVIPQNCPRLQATFQQVGADMGKLQVL